jgi:rod shape-determining protein MreD
MRNANIATVAYTLIVALTFQLYPWSGHGLIVRPDFLLVVIIYWMLRAPNICNIGLAWLAGLIVDLSTGSLLGQYALSFTITAYLGLQYQRRIVLFNQLQLTAYVLALFITERILVLILKVFSGNDMLDWSYLLPIVSNLALWLLIVKFFGVLTRPRSQ